jgi:hypothetical protein
MNKFLTVLGLLSLVLCFASQPSFADEPTQGGYVTVYTGRWMGGTYVPGQPIADQYCNCSGTPLNCCCQLGTVSVSRPTVSIKGTVVYPCTLAVLGGTLVIHVIGVPEKMHPPTNQKAVVRLDKDTLKRLKLAPDTAIQPGAVKTANNNWTYSIR